MMDKFFLRQGRIFVFTVMCYNQIEGKYYEIQKTKEIHKEDEYGGFRITVLCKLENIRQIIPLDISTGDPMTPSEISYEYKSIFSDEFFEICAYNILNNTCREDSDSI